MAHYTVSELRWAARGRWFDILTGLGMPADSLTRRNKPCPACGGTDRFSFSDRNGTGAFVCRALERQGGDGFELVMHWLGCDFPAALEAVARALGQTPRDLNGMGSPAARPRPSPAPRWPRRLGANALRNLWRQGRPVHTDDPVGRYLDGRGLQMQSFPHVLRHHPALPYWHVVEGKPPLRLGDFPAMLAAVQGKDGRVVAIHRTYLTKAGAKALILDPETGKSLPVKKLKTRDDQVMPGAAIRLYPLLDGRLALTEGIETALAVRKIGGLAVWACVSAHGLSSVYLPEEAEEVFITADNDENGTGQRAAQALQVRLQREGRRVEILVPSTPGFDWLDVLDAEEEAIA